MRVLCVDDALPVMEDTVAMCEKLPQITSVAGFTRPKEALEWMETHSVDLALLDIDMPEISGLMLAQQVKQKYPDAKIIFLTAFQQYAVEAIKLRASGYLLKPVSLEDLEEEVAYADSRKSERSSGHVVVKTFGNFEIFVDGETLSFHRQKAKELLAYLIDRRGAQCTNGELISILWEDASYNRISYLKNLKSDLKNTLSEAGCEDILIQRKGSIGVLPQKIKCDFYDFMNGEEEAVRQFSGEYMSQYSWAENTLSFLNRMAGEFLKQN